MKFLSYDSKFGQLLLKLCYGCCLNILWFVCCLPIFTIHHRSLLCMPEGRPG